MEIERSAHADEHRRLELVTHLRHPLLLLRHADPDPHDVRTRAVDLLDDRRPLVVVELAVGRRIATHDPYARITPAQVQRQLDERPLVMSAIEVDALTGRRRVGAGAQHQLGTVDPSAEVVAERVDGPHERLAVREVQR